MKLEVPVAAAALLLGLGCAAWLHFDEPSRVEPTAVPHAAPAASCGGQACPSSLNHGSELAVVQAAADPEDDGE